MQSLAYLPASNGSANASLMTVTNIRSSGANTIKVNTVANAPVKFVGTMGTPHTFTDPVTGETITIISEASAVDFFGSISGSDVIIDQIAAGYTDLGSKVGDIIVIKPITEGQNNLYNLLNQSLNDDGSLKTGAITYLPVISDFVQSGGVWSTLTGLNAAMTALVAWQGGYRSTISAVASRAFTLNKDTYVDILRTTTGYTTVFSLVYTEVANNAAAPPLAANSIRIAKVVTGASAITSITQIGTDSLLNVIYPNGAVSASNVNLNSFDKMRLTMSGNTSLSSSGSVIAFDTVSFAQGSKLTRSGNTVVIGAGVSKVRVTTNIMADSAGTASYIFARIRVNTAELLQQLNGIASGFASVSMSDIFQVKQGDTISVIVECGSGSAVVSSGRLSSLLVEVVG